MTMEEKQKLFSDPPAEYRGKPFWAWNGKLEEQELLRQIDIMKEMGFGGYFMHSRTGLETEYLGKEWFELTNTCAGYGEKQGMESWLYDEDRWPSGSAGGMVTEDEAYRAMFLEMELVPPGVNMLLQKQTGSKSQDNSADRLNTIIRFACRITDSGYREERILKDDELPLAGETEVIFRTRYSECKDVYNGFTYLNTMDQASVECYLDVTHNAYARSCEGNLGSSITGIFTDEPHRGALFSTFSEGRENAVPYTPGLFEEFQKRFGYDLKEHLLELFLIREDNRIRKVARDYIELCQELFLENFAIPMQRWCQEHQLKFTGHVLHEDSLTTQTVMQGSLMRFYEYMDYPGVDVLTEENECWWIVKQVVSVARQLDKRWILSELYGCTGWQMNFEAYKNVGDWQALFGINLRCPHLSWYTMKGEAKRDFPASIFHQSAWYGEYHYLEDYYSRIHTFLSEGEPDQELLVLNPIESVWARAYSGAFSGLEARDSGILKLEERYRQVFQTLVKNRIDFDYGEEDLLSRHGRVENGRLFVGKCAYKKVLAAGMEVIRSSTLELLEEFAKQGGTVIFAGGIPEYVDTVLSDRSKKLASAATSIPFRSEDIAEACRSGNEIGIQGEGEEYIFAQVELDGGTKSVMLLNVNRKEGYRDLTICLGEGESAELWDARTGQVSVPEQYQEEGRLFVKTDIEKGGEKLYVVTSKKRDLAVGKQKHLKYNRIACDNHKFSYQLGEANICVLDMVSIETETGEVIPYMEVLKADQKLRDLCGIPHRGGEMLQPWYENKYGSSSGALGRIRLCYKFEAEHIPESLAVAVEDLEHILEIKINGQPVIIKSSGKWLDICFDKINIPGSLLQPGKNELCLDYDYYRTCGVEAVYLLGEFGVKIDEQEAFAKMTSLPEKLSIGDITYQGLPFYSGRLSYLIEEIEGLDKEYVQIKIPKWEGACLKFIGEEEKTIAFAPYEADIHGLKEIQLFLTRRNTFGPLHQLPAKSIAYGPDNFLTQGKEWSDAYVLYPQGIMGEPEFYRVSEDGME